ncbi:hypothetical protein BABINDRAFT_35336 [Babjeviella inositovora NRRL Y-12698]|uniref:K Homology domain-containing protein n=1 Tax=Babjeviella inositovora NRRL Y-12698 TaxID=984486 RepID=A0A1E3QRY4_9ASCO|nr:uncharacterized protein BABINDRAFT_35336 [Babjeviella inositovora NRRL Y-12698]ODQ80441.1 hypothetical protein BABINDRAFT_35336 [Babjeviella inositovora NRRL Y-12698]
MSAEQSHESADAPLNSVLPLEAQVAANEQSLMTYRILVSTREAGIIIGSNGHVVGSIRDETGVKAGVSRVINGCSDRILTIGGTVDSTARAIGLIAKAVIASPPAAVTYNFFPLKQLGTIPNRQGETTCLRLLIPHTQMGTLIGKEGIRIKAIQELYSVNLIASKNFLPNSSERIVEIQGDESSIVNAIRVMSNCLIEDFHSAAGTIYYMPAPRQQQQNLVPQQNPTSRSIAAPARLRAAPAASDAITQTVKFPKDLVGSLIGRRGAKIQEIRKVSQTQIIIDNEVDDDDLRLFTIVGKPVGIEKALTLLHGGLEKEKERRAEDAEDYEQTPEFVEA